MGTRRAEALLLRIDGDLGQLNRSLTRAEGRTVQSGRRMQAAMGKVDRGFNTMIRTVGRLRGVLAGAAVLGFGVLTKKALDFADSIAKTADSIGVTTDTLQEYRFAAKIAGVEQENLDKALKFFTKTVGEAKLETGELVTILGKYDKTLLENITTAGTVEEKLQAIFRVLGSVEDAFTRNALATKFFGRAGVAMVNIVKDGADALESMRARARELGIVIDEDLLRNAEDANDAMTTLAAVVGAQVTAAMLALAPLIVDVASALTDAAVAVRAFLDPLGTAFLVQQQIDGISDAIARLQGELEGAQDGAKDFLLLGGDDAARIEQRIEELVRRRIELESLLNDFKKAGEKKLTIRMAPAAKADSKELKALERAGVRVFEQTRIAAERYNIEIERLQKLLEAGAISQDTFNRAVENAQTRLQQTDVAMRTVNRSAERFGEGLVDAALKGENALVSLRNVALSVVDDIIKAFLKTQVIQPLISSLFGGGGGGSFLSSLFSGGGTALPSTGPFPQGFSGTFAHGGSFTVGGSGGTDSTLVAFRATPGENVTITPSGGGGGTTVNITNNIMTGVQSTIRAEIESLLPQMRAAALDAVRESRGRGGKFGEAFD